MNTILNRLSRDSIAAGGAFTFDSFLPLQPATHAPISAFRVECAAVTASAELDRARLADAEALDAYELESEYHHAA
jgi:hypothetical protein